MGYVAIPTDEMGEYSVEVRRESFYLAGEYPFVQIGTKPCPSGCDVIGKHEHAEYGYVKQRHAITVYPPTPDFSQGTVEILIEDIPKIRAALDQVERIASGHKLEGE